MKSSASASPSWMKKVSVFMEEKHVAGTLLTFFRKYTMLFALVLVTLFFCTKQDAKGNTLMLQPGNITGLILDNAYVLVLATGMLMCILTGGNIDLSVGSVLCFAGAIGSKMMAEGANAWLALGVMLFIGLLVGLFQGFWIAKVRVPAFIATLAGMYAFRGLASIVLEGMRSDITNV